MTKTTRSDEALSPAARSRASLLEELRQHYVSGDPAHKEMRRARLEAAVAQSTTDLIASPLVCGLLALALVPVAPLSQLLTWYAVQLVLIAHRWTLARRIRAGRLGMARVRVETMASLGATGCVYSLAMILLVPADNTVYQAITLVWLAGVSAAYVSAYALLLEAGLSFLLAAVLPAAVMLALRGGHLPLVLASVSLAFVAVMVSVALRNNIELSRSFLIRAEREILMTELAREKAYVDELNELLRDDILEREQAAADLRRAKEQAEELADQLMLLSSLDGLTGIANRRQFDDSLQKEWNRCVRESRPLSLILCDIDYFKRYNDRYGHQAGDACLKQVAAVLDGLTRRSGDIAARYGGEEFALLLPGTELDNASHLALRAREAIRGLDIEHETSALSDRVTASFGVASLIPQQDLRPALLVRSADQGLYRAKREGRDRVVTVNPLDATPDLGFPA